MFSVWPQRRHSHARGAGGVPAVIIRTGTSDNADARHCFPDQPFCQPLSRRYNSQGMRKFRLRNRTFAAVHGTTLRPRNLPVTRPLMSQWRISWLRSSIPRRMTVMPPIPARPPRRIATFTPGLRPDWSIAFRRPIRSAPCSRRRRGTTNTNIRRCGAGWFRSSANSGRNRTWHKRQVLVQVLIQASTLTAGSITRRTFRRAAAVRSASRRSCGALS
jgi:hypothetical protein